MAYGAMERPTRADYEPLALMAETDDCQPAPPNVDAPQAYDDGAPFSWLEYAIFAFLGVAMLWGWNMFLAAAPYFASRLAGDAWAESNFQSAILTVSTLTNLSTLVFLTYVRRAASYTFRINLALVVNSVVFAMLTCSTGFLDVSPRTYLAFLLCMVALSSWAMGLIQNGAFSFAASFGRPEYMQALMAGQGVSGVLPPIAQVVTVLAFPPADVDDQSPEPSGRQPLHGGQASALTYFLTAVVVCVAALVTTIPLVRRHRLVAESRLADSMAGVDDAERAASKASSSLWALLGKLRWLAVGVALTFAVTMFFPVFTVKIRSVHEDGGLLFRPPAFVPLAFFFWNLGDLAGRVATMLPFSLRHMPALLVALAALRTGQLPLYLLCNLGGRGALVPSDLFYLVVVQLGFGLTNGWLGSSFMMASGECINEGEREAAGGLMGLFLVLGLTAGSLLSFTISGI